MKKLLLILMLAIMNNYAKADWIEVGINEKFTVYADPTTIRKTVHKVKMWTLYDYKELQKPGILSTRHEDEYECEKKQRQGLSISAYSGHMADGETIYYIENELDDDWQPVPPDSIFEAIMKFACWSSPQNATTKLRQNKFGIGSPLS